MPPPFPSAPTAGAPTEADLLARIEDLEQRNARLLEQLTSAVGTDELVVLDDDQVLQQVGIYRYHHPLENAAAYKVRLDDLGARVAEMVRAGQAIEASNQFTYDNSLAKGRQMVKDLGRLMLRAYNAEAANCIRTLRVGNVVTAKKREHLLRTIASLETSGTSDPDLQARRAEVDAAIEQNDFRAANVRAGYVYVISNRGAFGEQVVKIGLTRRLEPQDRITELGGASVPFRFDVHALFFSEDAVSLETELHQHIAARAVNQANSRKEFFFATPSEVRDVLREKVGNLLEFSEHAAATEYLQSVGAWPELSVGPGPARP